MIPDPLEISVIHAAYRAGTLTPLQLVSELLDRIAAYPDKAVFILQIPAAAALAQAEALDLAELDTKPLFGIPYVVKDNIDVGGLPTTAACPDFAYLPAADAVVVARLRAAGAILLGKTNLDQFATGLNGTRSPHGAPRCVFNPDYVSGGSSSGSAVAAGAGLAVFSLGTDTAGSGRVPAGINNLIGLKPTIGRIPTTGIVPASKTLDCVSIFANCAADALAVLGVAQGPDSGDAYSRPAIDHSLPAKPRLGILRESDRDFGGSEANRAIYAEAIAKAENLGWALVEFDYTPFREIAASLYGSAYIAERLTATREILRSSPQSLHPVLRDILESAAAHQGVDVFDALHRIQGLHRPAQAELAKFHIMLLPTAPEVFSVAQMLAEPIAANARLGLYTNFVNFLDLAAIAIPAGFRPDGLPFGVTLIGPAFSDAALTAHADALHRALGAGAGKSRAAPKTSLPPPAPHGITLVVAGAHLSGMVLNHELLTLGARRLAVTKTAAGYKLFALPTVPPKPGLVRDPDYPGAGIDVELWLLKPEAFGRFVASLPPPMGIGKVTLQDGTEHPGFLCEAHVLNQAQDITAYGGWRAYCARGAAG
jgi:allophanate hydrolase